MRAVEDDHVDRPGVQARQRVELTGTNRPTGLIALMIRVRIKTEHPHETDHATANRLSVTACRTTPKLVLRRPGGLSGVPRTRSHLELGRQTHQRPWYCVSRHGRVGRRQACPAQDIPTFPHTHDQRLGAGWSSPVARQAHNLKVAGSNPAPATKSQTPIPTHTRSPQAHASGLFAVQQPGPAQQPRRTPRGEGTRPKPSARSRNAGEGRRHSTLMPPMLPAG